MATDYISGTDAGKLAFGKNAVALMTPAPTTWGITTGILTTLTGLVNAFDSDLTTATDPPTRGPSATFAKNQSRDAMVEYIRTEIVPKVQGCATVTDQMKHDMGLTIRGANPPTPIGPPTIIPVATIRSVNGWTVDVQISAPGSESRGLPKGVSGINMYTYSAGPTAPDDPALWTYEGEVSKARFKVNLDPALPKGKTVFLTFCYKSPRFQTGPACQGVPVVVGGGIPETIVG